MPVELLPLVIYFLAAARLTGMIVDDVLFDAPRDALLGWLDPTPRSLGSYIAKLVTCQWCMAVWVCAAVVPLAWLFGHSPYLLIPATVLAFAQLVGMTSQIGR
jgi:hypothetical protein